VSRRPILGCAAAAFALGLVLSLGACGRKNAPVPPEGEESRYTFPGFYPARGGGVPIFGQDPLAPGSTARDRAGRSGRDDGEEQRRDSLDGSIVTEPFEEGYTSGGKYGTSPE
jgi:hypothetical protein